MELTEEEAKRALGLIMSDAHRIAQKSRITSVDWQTACENVAKNHMGGIDPVELRKSIGRVLTYNGQKRAAKNNPPNLAEAAKKSTTIKKPIVTLYREWADSNDWIPADKVIEHFSECTSPSYIRSSLRKLGYEFELIGIEKGFRVISRPKPRTPQNMVMEVLDAIKSGDKKSAAELLIELLNGL